MAGPRPTKVLHVLNGASGGAVMSTIALIKSLERVGVKSCAVCHPAGTAAEQQRLSDAVHGEVVFTPLYWWNTKTRHPIYLRPALEARQLLRTGWMKRSTWEIRRAVRRWKADLIHTSTILNPEGGMVAAQLGIPHVWHIRELIGPGKPFRFPREGRAFGDHLAAHASKVIANSRVTASQVASWMPPGLLEIVPNGIDLSQFMASTATPRPARDKLVVAMVAGLEARWKKHVVFVKAALRVDRALPVEFRIYGHDRSQGGTLPGTAYTDELHALIAQADAKARFVWPGHVNDPRQVMAEIDILAHSADHESFGRVIVEGMAAGLPVVGVDGGGVGEIVLHDRTGLLVPPDDFVAMGQAIEALVRDPARRAALGAAGRQHAEDTYSLDACARGVLAVYEAAMARPVRPLER
ncbi:MAG: glycosyltransferase family 4 protein [Proteobacteria bacterium]|nr:glycosyltransferase family 4 protein [Pseudomonadota bacterium]